MTEVVRMLEVLRVQRVKLDAAIAALEALSDDGQARPIPSGERQGDPVRQSVRTARRPVPAPRKAARMNGAAENTDSIEQRMLAVMADGEVWTAPHVAGVLGCKVSSAAAQLADSTQQGKCVRIGRGRYRLRLEGKAVAAANPVQQTVGPHRIELRGKVWTCQGCLEQRNTPGGFIPLAECTS